MMRAPGSRVPASLARGASIAFLGLGGMALWGCDARVQLVEPRASAAPPTVLTLAASDTALATRAGWTPGVPATTVHIRQDQNLTVLSYTTDDHGVLTLPDLTTGDYWVWAERYSTTDESQAPVLAPPALGGGLRIGLDRGASETVELRSQENGSLVISEFHYHSPPFSVVGADANFFFYWYIELYNNSDTTIYLDGKIVGRGFNYWVDAELWPCTETQPFRNEPRGIWSRLFQAFPGTGHEYPLPPGKTVLIAEEAIDHSAITPGLPDLTHADFQFAFPAHVVNPAVPAMLPIQISSGNMLTMFYKGPEVVFLAEPVEVASLERKSGRYWGEEGLFPRDVILDLAVLYGANDAGPQTAAPYCRSIVDPSLDPLAAFVRPGRVGIWNDSGHLFSAQRKLLPDGRHLQRTGTSAVDWEIRPRSPGEIP